MFHSFEKTRDSARTDRVIIERSSSLNDKPIPWTQVCKKYASTTSNNGTECYMCQHVDLGVKEDIHPRMLGLAHMIREQFTQKSLDDLAHMCCEYMKSEFSPPPTYITPEQVKEHLLYHVMSPSIHVTQTIRCLTTLERFLRDHLISQDRNGVLVPNCKMMSTYLNVQQRLADVYKLKPDEMNFHNTTTDVSL